jgi:hypothetical protein
MKNKNKLLTLFALLFAAQSFIIADEKSSCSFRAQDLNVETSLCMNNSICPYLEVDIGYRYDRLKNTLELYNSIWDILGQKTQKVDFTLLTFRGGVVIHKYAFLKGDVAYGFMDIDKENEASYLEGTSYLINSYQKDFMKGYSFDGLVGGGFRIPLYKKYLALDTEIGYDYRKINIDQSIKLRVSSPYVAATLYGALGCNLQLNIYGGYFFSPHLVGSGYLYLVKSDSFIPAPGIDTKSDITAYKVGSNFSYMFTKHLSVNFNWERFSADSGFSNGTFSSNVLGTTVAGLDKVKVNYWISNQFQVGLRYSF